jgi:multiple sugar transport system substrate-binding protein
MKRWLVLGVLAASAAVSAQPRELVMWRHDTGDAEMVASAEAVARFNARQQRWRVRVETLPQGSYQQAVVASALSGRLPCVLTLDQPTVPNFAWAGHIRALEGPLRPVGVDALIPGGRSGYAGKLYAVGQFDVALALFARRSVLQRHGIRLATIDAPYAAEEFRTILRSLKAAGWRHPLDMHADRADEWPSYKYSPWLQSAGADLIDRRTYRSADGVINGPAAVAVGRYFASLFAERLVSRKPIDDHLFTSGRAVFQYSGSFDMAEYRRLVGPDLVILPPPDFGRGPRIGAGSWQWAISATCSEPEGARTFLEHLITVDEIAAFSRRTALMPTLEAAADRTELYRPGGEGRAFFEFARAFAVLRPETPAYPVISSAFAKAMRDIRDGADVPEALDRAADTIRDDLARHHGYGH